jgi:hypothetical protein
MAIYGTVTYGAPQYGPFYSGPVTDRTQADVDEILRVKRKIQAQGVSGLTAAELAYWNGSPKGAFNVADHVRIEQNTAQLMILIALILNDPPGMIYTNPAGDSLGYAGYINKLCGNIQAIRAAVFPALSTVPGYAELKTNYTGGAGSESPNYETLNHVEQDLVILEKYARGRYDTAPFSDTFYCGGTYL